jgi:hypothetical protein
MTGPHDTVTTPNIWTTKNGGTGADTSPASTTTNPQLPHENGESADAQTRREGRPRWTLRI